MPYQMAGTRKEYQFKPISPIRILSFEDAAPIDLTNRAVNGAAIFTVRRERELQAAPTPSLRDLLAAPTPSLRDLIIAPWMNSFGAGAEDEQLPDALAEQIREQTRIEEITAKLEEGLLALEYLTMTRAMEEAGTPVFNRVYHQYKKKTAQTNRHDKYLRCITQCNAMKKRFPENKKLIGNMIRTGFSC